MTPPAWLYARLSAAHPLAALLGRRTRRAVAIRAERAARPTRRAPLITACCPTWPTTGGSTHERTCHTVTEETEETDRA